MRVVSWNLARNSVGRSNITHERAWRFLEALDPDIALLQEVDPPDWVAARDGWTLVPGRYEKWGSAILAKTGLNPTAFDGEPEGRLERVGYLATGTVSLADGSSLLLGSVHAPISQADADDLGGRHPEDVKRPLEPVPYHNDVAYAIYRDRVKGRPFLVSGDWNVSRLWDYHYSQTHELDFFRRAEHDGWVECYRLFHPEGEGRTWYRDPEPPYQQDHAFCDTLTAESLTSCVIDPYPAARLKLSDHAPLIMEFRT